MVTMAAGARYIVGHPMLAHEPQGTSNPCKLRLPIAVLHWKFDLHLAALTDRQILAHNHLQGTKSLRCHAQVCCLMTGTSYRQTGKATAAVHRCGTAAATAALHANNTRPVSQGCCISHGLQHICYTADPTAERHAKPAWLITNRRPFFALTLAVQPCGAVHAKFIKKQTAGNAPTQPATPALA